MVGVFWFLFQQAPLEEVMDKMISADLWLVLASLGVFIMIPLTQSRRWQILIKVFQGELSLKKYCSHVVGTIFQLISALISRWRCGTKLVCQT